jgi:hypothetical protein
MNRKAVRRERSAMEPAFLAVEMPELRDRIALA